MLDSGRAALRSVHYFYGQNFEVQPDPREGPDREPADFTFAFLWMMLLAPSAQQPLPQASKGRSGDSLKLNTFSFIKPTPNTTEWIYQKSQTTMPTKAFKLCCNAWPWKPFSADSPPSRLSFEIHLLHSGLLSGKEKKRILELFLFWHKVVTQRNAEKPYNRTVYIHTNYTISSSMQVLCVIRLVVCNQMVFEWSIFDTPFTSEWESCLSFFSPRSVGTFWLWGQ